MTPLLRTRFTIVAFISELLLDATPSPGEETEKSSRGESRPCKPDEGGIGLRLSAAVDAVYIGINSVLPIDSGDTTVDDVVVGEMCAHGMRLVAAAVDGYPGSESLLAHNSLALRFCTRVASQHIPHRLQRGIDM